MEHNLRINLFFAFFTLVVGIMITPYSYIGLAFVIFSIVWAYLFILPISPIKRSWAISDKLIVSTLTSPGYKPHINNDVISVWVELKPRSSIKVDKIVLAIRREKIPSLGWKAHKVVSNEHKYMDFKKPDWLNQGNFKLKLIAYTPEGYSKSGQFVLEVSGSVI